MDIRGTLNFRKTIATCGMNVTIASPSNIIKAVPYSPCIRLCDLDVEDAKVATYNWQLASITKWILIDW